jgi:hypothetical protein
VNPYYHPHILARGVPSERVPRSLQVYRKGRVRAPPLPLAINTLFPSSEYSVRLSPIFFPELIR